MSSVIRICHCGFLFWNYQALLPVFLTRLGQTPPVDCGNISTTTTIPPSILVDFFSTLDDVSQWMRLQRGVNAPSLEFEKDVIVLFEKVFQCKNLLMAKHFVEPVCVAVETSLRLQVHAHLQAHPISPFDVRACIQMDCDILRLIFVSFVNVLVEMCRNDQFSWSRALIIFL